MTRVLNILLFLLIIVNVQVWQTYYNLSEIKENLEIYILDVGQGDSILIKTPNNRFGLIDGGRGNLALKQIESITPKYITEFEFVIFTHPDADHIEGLNYILKTYKVNNVFIQDTKKNNDLIQEAKDLIMQKKIKNFQITNLNDFTLEKVEFDILWPLDYSLNEDSNSSSTALTIKYGNFSFFTAGDLNDTNELNIAKDQMSYEVDALKVSHHGSTTSTNQDFIELIKPKAAFISVGKENRYGHPSKEILDRLIKENVDVYRTDISHTIRISVQKDFFIVYTSDHKEKYYN